MFGCGTLIWLIHQSQEASEAIIDWCHPLGTKLDPSCTKCKTFEAVLPVTGILDNLLANMKATISLSSSTNLTGFQQGYQAYKFYCFDQNCYTSSNGISSRTHKELAKMLACLIVSMYRFNQWMKFTLFLGIVYDEFIKRHSTIDPISPLYEFTSK